ncbi:unnamed protein product, partial [Mesorhabditis belari]|uniref:7TM GPCR serpentine receptor class x (Srx) domain-containing protein n=1 Tax=Mesorhabditis belari TaxID=2138241 RepID=A0AAF3FBL6_9BILA
MWSLIKPDHVAGIAIVVCSLLGVVANGAVVFWISRLASMQNAFGRLTRNQATADLLHACSFCFYFGPMLIFDIQTWKSEEVSSWFGHFQLIFYDACNASHLFVSINRVVAIFVPILYNRLFSNQNVTLMHMFCWFTAIVPSIWAYRIADCRFYYYDAIWTYTFASNPECMVISWYYDFIKSITTIIIIVILDFITFTKCRIHGQHLIASLSDARSRQRKREEIVFVWQASLQGFIFILELITFFVFPPLVDNRGFKFTCTTIAWILVHSFDGVIAVCFNREFRRLMTSNIYDSSHHPTVKTESSGGHNTSGKQQIYSTDA